MLDKFLDYSKIYTKYKSLDKVFSDKKKLSQEINNKKILELSFMLWRMLKQESECTEKIKIKINDNIFEFLKLFFIKTKPDFCKFICAIYREYSKVGFDDWMTAPIATKSRLFIVNGSYYSNGSWALKKNFVPKNFVKKYEQMNGDIRKVKYKNLWKSKENVDFVDVEYYCSLVSISENFFPSNMTVFKSKSGDYIIFNEFYISYLLDLIGDFKIKVEKNEPYKNKSVIYCKGRKVGLIMPLSIIDSKIYEYFYKMENKK